MTLIAEKAQSRRRYLSFAELEQFADIRITNEQEAKDRISQAEELLDAYLGFAEKFLKRELLCVVKSVDGKNIEIDKNYKSGFLTYTSFEVLKGGGQGSRNEIEDNEDDKITCVATPTDVEEGSVLRIYQLGKYPRAKDCQIFGQSWIKTIPEEIRRGVAFQVAFMIEQGDEYFNTDVSAKTSESIGDYSYSKGGSNQNSGFSTSLISPRTKDIVKNFVNRVGKFV